jgi:hypothetical protein
VEKQNHLYSQWKDFYYRRGGRDFFGYDIDDPKIRLGFIKIGNLQTIYINGTEIVIPKSPEELDSFRKILVNTNITNWTVE